MPPTENVYKAILTRSKGYRLYVGVEFDHQKSRAFKKLTTWVVNNDLFLDTFGKYSTYKEHDKELVGYQIWGPPIGKQIPKDQLLKLVKILDGLVEEIPSGEYVIEFYEGGIIW